MIEYNKTDGLHIMAYKNELDNDRQELFIPERYIICVGVDYESKQPD